MTKKEKIISAITNQERENAVNLSIDFLDSKGSILDLYENALRVALYQIDCAEGDKECIWREHIKSSIVRSIIEISYPYLLKEINPDKKKDKKVLVVCPREEFHEIGAKMVHHYFLLHGYDAIFVGANTPNHVIYDAIDINQPDMIALSVTNYYNVIAAKQITDYIKTNYPNIKILAGGQAFNEQDALNSIQADHHITTFESIGEL